MVGVRLKKNFVGVGTVKYGKADTDVAQNALNF